MKISVVTPAFNEQDNLVALHARLRESLDSLGAAWEWIVVDDHSEDETPEVIARLAADDSRVRGVRFTRNHGSHLALRCGLDRATGDCAVLMAADLQDPPEMIARLVEEWQGGATIVWAVREARQGESLRVRGPARVYYWLMQRLVGLDMPARGADFVLVGRRAIDAVRKFDEPNVSLFALLSWLGFPQEKVTYVKQARQSGRSGWSLGKRLKLLVDSVTAFSSRPVRFVTYFGFAVAAAGFAYALVVLANAIVGRPVEGWSSLMVAVLLLGGAQMVTLGVLGEYLWRALDAARRRPKYVVETEFGQSRESTRSEPLERQPSGEGDR